MSDSPTAIIDVTVQPRSRCGDHTSGQPATEDKSSFADLPRLDRLLVATDLSPVGNQAIPWAYAAVRPGGAVMLVHVVEPWTVPSPLVPHYERTRTSRGGHRRSIAATRAKLAALVPKTGVPTGVMTTVTIVEDTDAARGIRRAAHDFEASVVCLAAKHRTMAAEALFGATVRKVVGHSPVPVLLITPAKK